MAKTSNRSRRQKDKLRKRNARMKQPSTPQQGPSSSVHIPLKSAADVAKFPSNLQSHLKDQMKKHDVKKNTEINNTKKREYAKNRYAKDKLYREKKKEKARERYKLNAEFRESLKSKYKANKVYKECKKKSERTKYKTNISKREQRKNKAKTRYQRDEEHREYKKELRRTKYRTNEMHRELEKMQDKLRYKTDLFYRISKQKNSKIKYATDSCFRHMLKSASKSKYHDNEMFRQQVKSASRSKYQRFESFRNKLKASSIKKYSSNPLFRIKLQMHLKAKYHNDPSVKEKKRQNLRNISKAIKKFKQSVEDIPIYVCTVCIRSLYRKQVKKCNRLKYNKDGILNETASETLTGKYIHTCNKHCRRNCSQVNEWICFTCHSYLSRNSMPPQAQANSLELEDIPPEIKNLNNLERQLVALRIPFMKILSLPKGGQQGVKGPCINVPSDLNTVTTTLPRPMNDSQMIKVKLKRKLEYKGHQQYEWVNPTHVQEAIQYFIQHNKWYKNIKLQNMWYNPENDSDIILCEHETTENEQLEELDHEKDTLEHLMEMSDNNTESVEPTQSIVQPQSTINDCEDEDSNHNKQMLTEKTQNRENKGDIAAYPVETCLQPIDIGQEILDTNGKIFCLAPAENQMPKSIFKEEGIDAMAFPYLLPSGDFGFSMDRQVKLTPSKYFNVRLLSADTRFATDNQFIFFAQYVTEITQVISSLSIALRKGKDRTDDGKK